MEDSSEDIELLSCWPPPDVTCNNGDREQTGSSSQRDGEMKEHPPTGRTTDTSKRQQEDVPHKTVKKVKSILAPPGVCEHLADVALARWWRRTGRDLCSSRNLAQDVSPHTLLAQIIRFPQVQAYLRDEIKKLELLADRGDDEMRWDVLGSFYERTGDYSKAYNCLLRAVQNGAGNAIKLILERVLRQMRIECEQAGALSRLKPPPLHVNPPVQVERRKADSLSCEEFFLRYAITKTPLVITGLGSRLCREEWTLDHIRQVAGKCSVVTKRFVPGSAEWAQLEQGPVMTVESVIDRIKNPKSDQEKLYLFDWSLPLYCPNLANELTIPKYFAGDFLQRTANGSLYQDSWPSLFVAPQGLTSQLHIDAFGSNFWMALFKGTKRWTFYQGLDTPFLYPSYHHSLDPVFHADPKAPDLEKYPLLSLTQPREVLLQEGEILFVPAGSPHTVENVTETVAISANFVDRSNLHLVKQELKAQALADPRAEDLLNQLENLKTPLDIEREHLSYERFKSDHRNAFTST